MSQKERCGKCKKCKARDELRINNLYALNDKKIISRIKNKKSKSHDKSEPSCEEYDSYNKKYEIHIYNKKKS